MAFLKEFIYIYILGDQADTSASMQGRFCNLERTARRIGWYGSEDYEGWKQKEEEVVLGNIYLGNAVTCVTRPVIIVLMLYSVNV